MAQQRFSDDNGDDAYINGILALIIMMSFTVYFFTPQHFPVNGLLKPLYNFTNSIYRYSYGIKY